MDHRVIGDRLQVLGTFKYVIIRIARERASRRDLVNDSHRKIIPPMELRSQVSFW
jgi:hypothetical protein